MKILKTIRTLLLVVFAAIYSMQLIAQQQVMMIESTITGSQEQPRVISIVPWQEIAEPEYIGGDLQLSLTVDVFKPIDRDAFNKELRYIKATRGVK